MGKQLNIFVENRPGRLKSITESLYKCDIDIRAFAIQDRGEYGLMKLIVDKPKVAQLALADIGFACALKDVLAIKIEDKPGNLHKLTTALADNGINVVDVYGFVLQPHHLGVCCLEIENLKDTKAAQIVEDAGFEVLSDDELYNM